jgi:glycosyltransferase involved in cell wall biosynthesis
MSRAVQWVTACIPTYKCTAYLRHAVFGLLGQTYPYTRIIVINDGDRSSPWSVLSDIEDPRLIRFDMSENRGPYFCLAVALEATDDQFFLVQDADDWSAPHRISCLLQLLQAQNTHYAFSTQRQFIQHRAGGLVIKGLEFSRVKDIRPSADLKYIMPHHGLFRVSALRRLGGYFAGFKFGYDLFLMNVMLMAGTVSWSPEYLYWRRLRTGSLTQSIDTGIESIARKMVRARLNALYREIYTDYINFLGRRLSSEGFLHRVRSRVTTCRGARDAQSIKDEGARLRYAMRAEAERYHLRRLRS